MPISDKVYRIPRGLVGMVDTSLQRILDAHAAGTLAPFCYDGSPGTGWLVPVKVRVIIEEEEVSKP